MSLDRSSNNPFNWLESSPIPGSTPSIDPILKRIEQLEERGSELEAKVSELEAKISEFEKKEQEEKFIQEKTLELYKLMNKNQKLMLDTCYTLNCIPSSILSTDKKQKKINIKIVERFIITYPGFKNKNGFNLLHYLTLHGQTYGYLIKHLVNNFPLCYLINQYSSIKEGHFAEATPFEFAIALHLHNEVNLDLIGVFLNKGAKIQLLDSSFLGSTFTSYLLIAYLKLDEQALHNKNLRTELNFYTAAQHYLKPEEKSFLSLDCPGNTYSFIKPEKILELIKLLGEYNLNISELIEKIRSFQTTEIKEKKGKKEKTLLPWSFNFNKNEPLYYYSDPLTLLINKLEKLIPEEESTEKQRLEKEKLSVEDPIVQTFNLTIPPPPSLNKSGDIQEETIDFSIIPNQKINNPWKI